MPVGNGRMGTLVWTTPSEVRLQINRVDVYANNSYSNSFIERHNDYCGGCAYVDIDFGAAQNEVFVAPAFKQQLSVYEAVMSLAGKQTSVEMIACPERDVIAAQVHTRGAGPSAGPVEIRLRMLRKASQYFGGGLETFAREHIAAVQTRSHLAKCRLQVEGERIALTQEFTEDDYYNKSAVAIALEGQAAKAEIVNETDVRLTAHISVAQVQLRSLAGAECRVANPWQGRSVVLKRDGNRAETVEGELLRFPSKQGEFIELART